MHKQDKNLVFFYLYIQTIMHKHSKIYDADSYAVTLGKGHAQISEPDLFYILLNFVLYYTYFCGHPLWLRSKEPTCQCRRFWFSHWVRKISWRREWQPAPISLPGKAHGQKKLTGPSAWNCKRFGHNLRLKTYLFLHLKLDLNPPHLYSGNYKLLLLLFLS